jgi:paraquat-inducible protein B
MARKQDYFKLGAFIIVGTAILVAVIIILGAGQYFKTSYTIETYFNESVNGLEIGSPVKLRGVSIGRVADIDFVLNKYRQANQDERRYVYVECEIEPDIFGQLDSKKFREAVAREVKQGLRVRPTSLGLTGQLFLNLGYNAEDESTALLKTNWTPETNYIPSVPSTMSRIEAAVTTISRTLSGLNQEDIKSIISDVKSIVGAIDDFMKTEGGKAAGKKVLSILEETRILLARTNTLMGDPAADTLIPNAAKTLESVNRVVTESEPELIAAVKEARAAMASFRKTSDVLSRNLADPRMEKAMSNLPPALENISDASRELAAAVAKIHILTNRLNGLAASEEATIHSIFEDTREIMENIKDLSHDAKRYPSGVIFGTPPAQAQPKPE